MKSGTVLGSIRWLVVRYYVLIVVVTVVDFVFGGTFVVHMANAGIEPALIGTMLAGTGLVSIVLEVPTGALADRYGNRPIMAIGLVVWGLGQMLFGRSHDGVSIAVALFILNIGIALFSGAPISYTMNALNRTGNAESVQHVARVGMTWRWAGAAAGGAAVLLGEQFIGSDEVTMLSGALLVLASIWVMTAWEPEPKFAHEDRAAKSQPTFSAGARFLRSADGSALALAYCGLALGQGALVLVWQPKIVEDALLPPSLLGLVLVVLTAAAATGSMCTRLMRRMPPTRSAAASLVLIACGLAVSSFHGYLALAGFVLAELGLGACGALLSGWGQAQYPDHLRNTLTSTFAALFTMTVSGSQLLVGIIWNQAGLAASTISVAMAVIVSSGALLFLGRRKEGGIEYQPAVTAEGNSLNGER